MSNVLLGKTLKAMYKLSGKTLTQLSEESGLTVDTINNLFYARIQKPGLTGVCALVHAMGFTPQMLISFMEACESLPENVDITEKFTNYIHTVQDAKPSVPDAKSAVKPANPYLEDIREQHRLQLAQMDENSRRMEAHFLRSIDDLKTAHERETARMDEMLRQNKKNARHAIIALGVETLFAIIILLVDVLNRSIGWFR